MVGVKLYVQTLSSRFGQNLKLKLIPKLVVDVDVWLVSCISIIYKAPV